MNNLALRKLKPHAMKILASKIINKINAEAIYNN